MTRTMTAILAAWIGIGAIAAAGASAQPAPVTDMEVLRVSYESATLRWTVPFDFGIGEPIPPGDDDVVGIDDGLLDDEVGEIPPPVSDVRCYDLRYSTEPVTAANFGAATAVGNPPLPGSPGTLQTFQVRGLSPETRYWFAIKIGRTATGPWSLISNVVDEITNPPPPDVTPPATVANLAVSGAPGMDSVTLTWTAPGDDASTGTAARYDLRYASTGAITTAAQFAAATAVTGLPSPRVAGSAESVLVTGLTPDLTYHFAIIAIDEAANAGALSNCPAGVTIPDTTAPLAISDLAVSVTLQNSLTLAWTSPTDPGRTRAAAAYDLRLSMTDPIVSESDFEAAIPVSGLPAPGQPGSVESFTLEGLSGNTAYHFAIRSGDSSFNWSAVSNGASAVTDKGGSLAGAAACSASTNVAGFAVVVIAISVLALRR